MEEKETIDHKKIVITATRQVLLEVFKLLEKFHESLILIGGWVPIMIIPEAGDKHVGTLDVDLAINDKSLHETGSETMEDILLANGYQHGTEPGRYFKKIQVNGKPIVVPVDFLTSEQRYIPKNEFYDITGIHATTSPGCELSFEANEKITLKGKSAGRVALFHHNQISRDRSFNRYESACNEHA